MFLGKDLNQSFERPGFLDIDMTWVLELIRKHFLPRSRANEVAQPSWRSTVPTQTDRAIVLKVVVKSGVSPERNASHGWKWIRARERCTRLTKARRSVIDLLNVGLAPREEVLE